MVATVGPFPNNLRVLRHRKGLNQRQASLELGIHRNRLSQMESGRELPTWETAQKLMAFYGVALSVIWPNPLEQMLIAESDKEREGQVKLQRLQRQAEKGGDSHTAV